MGIVFLKPKISPTSPPGFGIGHSRCDRFVPVASTLFNSSITLIGGFDDICFDAVASFVELMASELLSSSTGTFLLRLLRGSVPLPSSA